MKYLLRKGREFMRNLFVNRRNRMALKDSKCLNFSIISADCTGGAKS